MAGSSTDLKIPMRNAHALILLAAGACLLPCHRAAAEIQYKAGEGWSTVDENGQATTEATASAQLIKAQNLEKAGDFHRAMLAYFSLTRKFPRSGAAGPSEGYGRPGACSRVQGYGCQACACAGNAGAHRRVAFPAMDQVESESGG